jgi:hypothetical protein
MGYRKNTQMETCRARDRDSGARCAPADRTDRLHRPDPSFSGRSRRSNVRDFQYSGSYVDVGAPVPSHDTMVNECGCNMQWLVRCDGCCSLFSGKLLSLAYVENREERSQQSAPYQLQATHQYVQKYVNYIRDCRTDGRTAYST